MQIIRRFMAGRVSASNLLACHDFHGYLLPVSQAMAASQGTLCEERVGHSVHVGDEVNALHMATHSMMRCMMIVNPCTSYDMRRCNNKLGSLSRNAAVQGAAMRTYHKPRHMQQE